MIECPYCNYCEILQDKIDSHIERMHKDESGNIIRVVDKEGNIRKGKLSEYLEIQFPDVTDICKELMDVGAFEELGKNGATQLFSDRLDLTSLTTEQKSEIMSLYM